MMRYTNRRFPLPYLYVAFTPDTCSLDTSCIHLYPDTRCLSGILVSGYMYLVLTGLYGQLRMRNRPCIPIRRTNVILNSV